MDNESFSRDEECVITLCDKLTRLNHSISAKHKLMFLLIIQLRAMQIFHFVGKSFKSELLNKLFGFQSFSLPFTFNPLYLCKFPRTIELFDLEGAFKGQKYCIRNDISFYLY